MVTSKRPHPDRTSFFTRVSHAHAYAMGGYDGVHDSLQPLIQKSVKGIKGAIKALKLKSVKGKAQAQFASVPNKAAGNPVLQRLKSFNPRQALWTAGVIVMGAVGIGATRFVYNKVVEKDAEGRRTTGIKALNSVLKRDYDTTVVYGTNKTFDAIIDNATDSNTLISDVRSVMGAPLDKKAWLTHARNANPDSLQQVAWKTVREQIVAGQITEQNANAKIIPIVSPLKYYMDPNGSPVGMRYYRHRKEYHGGHDFSVRRDNPTLRDNGQKVDHPVSMLFDTKFMASGYDDEGNGFMQFDVSDVFGPGYLMSYVHVVPPENGIYQKGQTIPMGTVLTRTAHRNEAGFGVHSSGEHLDIRVYKVVNGKRKYLNVFPQIDKNWTTMTLGSGKPSDHVVKYDPALQIVVKKTETYDKENMQTDAGRLAAKRATDYFGRHSAKLPRIIKKRRNNINRQMNGIDRQVDTMADSLLTAAYNQQVLAARTDLALLQNDATSAQPEITIEKTKESSSALSVMKLNPDAGLETKKGRFSRTAFVNTVDQSPYIDKVASLSGRDRDDVLTAAVRLAGLEGGLNPYARNASSSASGIYQLTKGTRATFKNILHVSYKTGTSQDALKSQTLYGTFHIFSAAQDAVDADEKYMAKHGKHLFGKNCMWEVDGETREIGILEASIMGHYGTGNVYPALAKQKSKADAEGKIPKMNGRFYASGQWQDFTTHLKAVPISADQQARIDQAKAASTTGQTNALGQNFVTEKHIVTKDARAETSWESRTQNRLDKAFQDSLHRIRSRNTTVAAKRDSVVTGDPALNYN